MPRGLEGTNWRQWQHYFRVVTKKPKQKPVKPDEVFIRGPLRIARYGNNVVWETNWPEGAHAEMQKRAVGMYPEVVKEIDELVESIAKLVSELAPDKLLHRAWWEHASRAVLYGALLWMADKLNSGEREKAWALWAAKGKQAFAAESASINLSTARSQHDNA